MKAYLAKQVLATHTLGLYDLWVSLEELLATLQPPLQVPEPKYLRAAIERN